MEMDFPASFKSWHSRDPIALFSAPVAKSVNKDKTALAKQLETEARAADTLVLWLDCDLEGENICFEVIEVRIQSRHSNIV